MEKELKQLIEERSINTGQHLLCIICNKFLINISQLDTLIIGNKIDFSPYTKSSINLLLEYFHSK